MDRFSRMAMIVGDDGVKRLSGKRVAVFGIGGVGGYAVEALARAGIGTLDLIDSDRVDITNINRQIIALTSTIGRYKTEVARERILDINPDAAVNIHNTFYTPGTASLFDFSEYDYVVDAIDTVTGKIELVMQAERSGTPIISCLGTGNKLDPARLECGEIFETSVCPLAKVMRRELRARGVKKLKVVYSREEPVRTGSRTPGSISFVPAVAGMIIGGEVVRDLLKVTL